MPRSKRGDKRKARKQIRDISVGHDVIDADNEAIVECFKLIADSTVAETESQLHRLRSLLENHFHNEELLLKAAGSDLCDCHVRDNQLILALCDRAISTDKDDSNFSRKFVLSNLIPALREHIAYRDQLIALYLNTREADTRGLPN